jgi:hypothetical protein
MLFATKRFLACELLVVCAFPHVFEQDYSRNFGDTECLGEFKGLDLLGLPLSAPNAQV